jgi:hypothetical protein
MVSLKRAQSKPRTPTGRPDLSPGLVPGTAALSFTLILTQIQAAYQADHQNLAIVLISVLTGISGKISLLKAGLFVT